jgi:hypothetical protein
MTSKILVARFALLLLVAGPFFLLRPTGSGVSLPLSYSTNGLLALEEQEDEEEETREFSEKRLAHELQMLRNPITGTIPTNIQEIEAKVLKSIPQKAGAGLELYRPGQSFRTANNNAYVSVGPNNVGGRGRALAFDRRNASIVLTGGVTGGIFRSIDGGANWTFVSGENDIRSATSIAQDPVNPNTWYCGTGEVWYPLSAQDIAGTVGYGVYKSTNNGVTWTKLSSTEDGAQHVFNGGFDIVNRMVVHPTTGHVYAAVHNRIMKSTDGGASWLTVLGGTAGQTAGNGITEIVVASNGSKLFAAFTGSNSDRALAGVWESTTGNGNDWRRIAGGVAGQADSVAGWQPYGQWSRVVLALNSTNTRLFALYKNGKSASGANPQPEADLFRADVSSGNSANYTWTNLNAYVPDDPNYNRTTIDPYTTQFAGYNMSITVKPDNDNILFIGGTVLHRVDLTKTDQAQKFRRIGGYGDGFFPAGTNSFIYPNHHPDIHKIVFAPGATDQIYTVSDGGVHRTTTSVMADTVRWEDRNTNLQTLQYQFITIQPDAETDFIMGGTQDNGTQINLNPATEQDHIQIQGGDGASAAISQFFKTGNTWRQYWYTSVSNGYVERANLTWELSGNTLNFTSITRNDITPTGLASNGQWLTLFINDPDSTETIYYNSKNKLYRTTSASTVTPSTWTELSGVGDNLPANHELSTMAVSKARNSIKYLYLGTDAGKVYRLDNSSKAAVNAVPRDITPTTMTAGSYVAGISINPRNPDTVMVVVSNYDAGATVINNIFWTGNATAASPTWQVIDGALGPVSSQSCAIVLKTTGVEYYVGTSVGLYSTTAINGNSTQWFNEGAGMMKRAIIRSLYYRQKDNTLVVGTHGNGAFVADIGNAVVLNNNIVTGISSPITNDRNFIQSVFPTIVSGDVYFTVGNMFAVRNITVQLFGMNGQQVYSRQQGYQNGSVKTGSLPAGNYVLQVTSSDGRYRHVQKILKQ